MRALPGITIFALAAAASLFLPSCGKNEPKKGGGAAKKHSGFPGYTLVQQLGSKTTSLIDMDGRPVHRWVSENSLGGGTYLLDDGRLLRSAVPSKIKRDNPTPGLSGMVELLDWDGKALWSYTLSQDDICLHHDTEPLPNGNILLLVMEEISPAEQIELGRDPARAKAPLKLDYLIEMKPEGKEGGQIVWEWHMKDHLIQDFDKTKKNFGVVSDHPEKLDINFIENPRKMNSSNLRQMQSLGYVGSTANIPAATRTIPDWTHANSVAYHPKLDQVLMSVRSLGEIWIIDHSTTTAEAAASQGGRMKKGGGVLYRWGNPQSYQRGAPADQKLFGQHDAQWIKPGHPGEGNILVYNNGEGRKDGEFSTIEEIKPPLKEDGSYELLEGEPFGPEQPAWQHAAEKKESFYSSFISGVQRLANGATLVCSGVQGWIFEVSPDGELQWEHKMEVNPRAPGSRGRPGMAGGAAKGPGGMAGKGPGIRRRPGMAKGPGMARPPGAAPAAGPPARQKKAAEGDSRFSLAEMEVLLGAESPLSIPPPMPPAAGGGGPPGAAGAGPGRGGPPGGGGLFRAVRYAADHPAFKGRKLEPLAPAVAGQ